MCGFGEEDHDQESKVTMTLTLDEARQLRQLLKHARAFAWKLKDAIESYEAVEARRKDWPHNP